MEVMLNFIVGSIDSPVKMAVCFMLFLCVLDSIFSLINTMVVGVMK